MTKVSTRITVRQPDELVAAVSAAVTAGQAASVSAYVASALREQAGRESVADVLADWQVEVDPLGEQDEAWAQAALSRAHLTP